MDRMENNKLFCYGILKRGFELDLRRHGAEFMSEAYIPGANLYHIHDGVGLRFSDDPLQVAHGEIFSIPDELWGWLDGIEANGHVYERKEVIAIRPPMGMDDDGWRHVWVYEHIYFPKEWYTEAKLIQGGIFK